MTNAVVAIGGNAILRKGEAATVENQMNNLRRTCAPLARMVKEGYGVTLVHGNGLKWEISSFRMRLLGKKFPPCLWTSVWLNRKVR